MPQELPMAERVVYLHAGLHKTATSSLQATCKANRAALLAQGVCYPLFHCVENGRRGIDNHSIPLRTAFNAAGRPYHISTLWRLQDLPSVSAAYRHTLEQVLAEHDRVLLSGEDVSAMALEDLRDLVACLQGAGATVLPVACVRSPYSHHCSAIQHALRRAVKGRGPMVPVTRFKSQLPKVRLLQQVFGEAITFLPFRQACAEPQGPVAAVLRRCAIDPAPLRLLRSNEGCSNVHFRQVWRELAEPAAQAWSPEQRQQRLELLRSSDAGPKFALTAAEVDALRERLDAENQAFRQWLGDAFCDQEYPVLDV